jgi:hypothetical protein
MTRQQIIKLISIDDVKLVLATVSIISTILFQWFNLKTDIAVIHDQHHLILDQQVVQDQRIEELNNRITLLENRSADSSGTIK